MRLCSKKPLRGQSGLPRRGSRPRRRRGRPPRRRGARERALQIALAPVVRGEREIPVAEHVMQARQVIERRARRREHVAPLVLPHVALQVERAPRGRHELPHPRRLRHGQRLRVVRRFDERQQREFGRHVARFELLDDVVQVLLRAFGHPLHIVGALRVPRRLHVDEIALQVGHLEAAADARPEIAVGGGEVSDRLLVDVDGFFRGSGLAQVVRSGLRVGGRGILGGRPGARARGERQDQ